MPETHNSHTAETLLTTGQAARLCAVTRDTVLKWIKSGKVTAVQTAGGHYRVKRSSLIPYATGPVTAATEDRFGAAAPAPSAGPGPRQVLSGSSASPVSYCWEFHSKDGEPKHDCRECMVFQSQARKCYLLAGLKEEVGPAGSRCRSDCRDCEYFHHIYKETIKVLVVTEDERLRRAVQAGASDRIVPRFTSCEYDTSAMVHDFKPDFIVVDDSMLSCKPDEICRHLIQDPRIHGAQIVLAVPEGHPRRPLQKGVCASMAMPFDARRLEDGFRRIRESLWGVTNQ